MMLQNGYLLAQFGFGTAENEPAKNCKSFQNVPNLAKYFLGDAHRGRNEARRLDALLLVPGYVFSNSELERMLF